MAQPSELSSLRWGILGCGLISSWFVSDLVLEREGAPVKHIVEAVGSSSREKGLAFLEKHAPSVAKSAKVYASYEGVYSDPNVDIIYIGTPHALHLKNALDAINAGKHVLCEKPMTINAKEAKILVAAAREKGVFLMEALWTRFFPIAKELHELVHKKQVIGKVSRVFCDFALNMPISSLPPSARTADPAMGAGALLDIGIYSLTWADIALRSQPYSAGAKRPAVVSSMSKVNGVDEMSTVILNYEDDATQAICTASMRSELKSEFCSIEGDKGVIVVGGESTSQPGFLIVKLKGEPDKRIDFETKGWGFHYEADAVALDLKAGRTENATMPLDATVGMMTLMDGIREQNGLRYAQDS